MGIPSCEYSNARRRAQPGGADDPFATHGTNLLSRLAAIALVCCLGVAAQAETYRIATFAAPLSRDGPGLLLRDILKGEDDQIAAVQGVILHLAPDILVLTDFDYDLDGLAMAAFADTIGGYPYRFAARPNAGMATGFDLDRNGYLGDARDAMGYGRFAGDGGMAVLSRVPIDAQGVTNLSAVLWKDFPDAVLPMGEEGPFLPQEVRDMLRLSSTGHWIVPITPSQGGVFSILVSSATPPVFDGPEDMNGLRNRDELRLWEAVLDGTYGPVPADFVLAANTNLDPVDGDGFSDAMAGFLTHPKLQDPHAGIDTADWPEEEGPGDLRVSYVLPARAWHVVDAGVFWPAPETPEAALLGEDGLAAGPHHLVWVDVAR